VSLAQLVTLTLEDEQVRRDNSISFDIKVKSTQTLLLDVTLVKIVMSNLLRNAGQYSADGRVLVEIDKDRVFVANQYSVNQYQTHEPQQYGFGFGLYLIETICEQQCWAIEVKTETGCFSVGISL
jgi:K+-sensing histidine kinase KdpD